uniref:(California timema) hypothetical protein n=1 Tax=Timema californicum TaxID=61474 RepID=A0A7R9IZS8_TIMCA|nr:unnamed protein product [Timema californicum]
MFLDKNRTLIEQVKPLPPKFSSSSITTSNSSIFSSSVLKPGLKQDILENAITKLHWNIPDWQQFVIDKLAAWKRTNLDWLHNFTGPIHIILYEKLIYNLDHELHKLLKFLDLKVVPNDFQCALERREGIYRRKKRVINFDPYTSTMKAALNKEWEIVYEAINDIVNDVDNKR